MPGRSASSPSSAGWCVTEIGRQPWIANGILRTADAASPVRLGAVLTTLVLFVARLCVVFSMGIYYINRLIENGPEGAAIAADTARRADPAALGRRRTPPRSALRPEE